MTFICIQKVWEICIIGIGFYFPMGESTSHFLILRANITVDLSIDSGRFYIIQMDLL